MLTRRLIPLLLFPIYLRDAAPARDPANPVARAHKDGAKPTRHNPQPSHAPQGKRRRQWR